MTDAVSGAESMADTIQEIGSAAQESQAPIQQSTGKYKPAGKLLWTSSTLEPNTLNNYLEL